MDIKEALAKGEELLKTIDYFNNVAGRYKLLSYGEAIKTVDALTKTADSLPKISDPENREQLIISEFKRRLCGEAESLEHRLTSKHYDFETIISLYGIPDKDIIMLKSWLKDNKEAAASAFERLATIERLYGTKDLRGQELPVPSDVPNIKKEAEDFAAKQIKRYHSVLGKLLFKRYGGLLFKRHHSVLGRFFQDFIETRKFLNKTKAFPTHENNSYFSNLTNIMAIGIPRICSFDRSGKVRLRERELISLYGHESMGHSLNQIITNSNGLPYFLTKNSELTIATQESVAQFYQKVIFEDLKNFPETQKKLKIKDKFDQIYEEEKAAGLLEEYSSKLFQYSITVLADKSFGNPSDEKTLEKKEKVISEFTLNPTYPSYLVENLRNSFDSQNNLSYNLVSELRYCAQPVQRALKEFEKEGILYEGEGRNKIDSVLLKGFWTPVGFVQNAKLKAKEK